MSLEDLEALHLMELESVEILKRNNEYQLLKRQRGAHHFSCIGRLKGEVSINSARVDLNLINQNLVTNYTTFEKSGFNGSYFWVVSRVYACYYRSPVFGEYSFRCFTF
jgi:hypothetical protein